MVGRRERADAVLYTLHLCRAPGRPGGGALGSQQSQGPKGRLRQRVPANPSPLQSGPVSLSDASDLCRQHLPASRALLAASVKTGGQDQSWGIPVHLPPLRYCRLSFIR